MAPDDSSGAAIAHGARMEAMAEWAAPRAERLEKRELIPGEPQSGGARSEAK